MASSGTPGQVDFVIVGGGVAGLRAAIALAAAGRVLILTKADATESNTGYAQGGIAAAVGRDDSAALHAADTIRAGDGLCDASAVDVLVQDGPRYVRELLEWGAAFDRNGDGTPALGLEAAHSVRRILHAGDATGREIGRTLWRQVIGLASVTTINHALVTDLIVEDGAVCGVRFFDQDGERRSVRGHATLLATGGAGQVYSDTTNPAVATGDGIALAFHAGARVADLEFVQFHPTALNLADAPRFLISEAVRGEGARLVNARGEPFMRRYHPDGDLAPRDVVARGIVREAERTAGPIFLTLSHLDGAVMRRRFPTIVDTLRQLGLDLTRDLIPVGPAAHYLMGGIDSDECGRTSLPRLFAAGETACTGVHGANRLASNSLLEGLVFGARAADAMQQLPRAAAPKADHVDAHRAEARTVFKPSFEGSAEARPAPDLHALPSAGSGSAPADLNNDAIRSLMWRSAGLFRSRAALTEAVAQLEGAYHAACRAAASTPLDPGGWRQFNLLTVAYLIARAALRREESRGGHFREDFPERDDARWRIHVTEARAPMHFESSR
jgi:L-aspartate oxidase